MIEFAAEKYGWRFEYITNELPAVALALLLRQNLFQNSNSASMTLMDKEAIDEKDMSWEELVRLNREALARRKS